MGTSRAVPFILLTALAFSQAHGAEATQWTFEPLAKLSGTTEIVAGDCDGDGRSDLVSFSRVPTGIRIWYGNDHEEKTIDTSLDGVVSAHLLDFDQNGTIDILVTHEFGTQASVILSQGKRNWLQPKRLHEFAAPIESSAIAEGKPGSPKILATIEQNTANVSLLALGTAQKLPAQYIASKGDFYSKRLLVSADLFNEQKIDLIANSLPDSTLGVCTVEENALDSKPPVFRSLPLNAMPKGDALTSISGLVIVDVNNDRFVDIVACSPHPAMIAIYVNPGVRGKDWSSSVVYKGRYIPAHLTSLDVDADGDQDIAVCWNQPSDGNKLWSWFKSEKGGSEWSEHIIRRGRQFYADVAVADIDKDGFADIIVSEEGEEGISVLVNGFGRAKK